MSGSGDQDRVEAVYRSVHPRLWRSFLSYTGDAELASDAPADIHAVVLFYGTVGADFALARAAYLGHFGEDDEWESVEGVREMEGALRAAGRDVTLHFYPGAQHWFFESNRPQYKAEVAELAWQRTIEFLRAQRP